MKLCKVIGYATSSIKSEELNQYKLLILKSIDENGASTGNAFLAVDTLGAGLSEVVAVATGIPAANALKNNQLPIDAAVIAILDNVTINKKEIYSKLKEG